MTPGDGHLTMQTAKRREKLVSQLVSTCPIHSSQSSPVAAASTGFRDNLEGTLKKSVNLNREVVVNHMIQGRDPKPEAYASGGASGFWV